MAFYGNPTGGFWSEVAKFFDPASTDWDNYQARELGYVFEYIDAQTVILLNKIPFLSYGFRSISQISFAILTVVVLYFIARELLPTFRRTSCFVLAMFFLLSPQMLVMHGIYFRCGKTVTAFWAALGVLCLIHWLKPATKPQNVGCIHSTGFGRLSVICHGQARGHDRFVVNWIEPYHGSYSALSKSNLPTPSIFCPFVHRSVLLLSLLGLSVVSIHH